MKNAIVYSKDNCPFCVKAKGILEDLGVEIEEIKIGRDTSKEDFVQEVLNKTGVEVSTVPQIFVDGDYIGGCDDLEAHLEKKVDTEDLEGGFDDFEL